MYNSLITNFVTKKGLDYVKYIQGAVLLERKKREKRYCPHYGTSDNQRLSISIQLQAEHPQRPWDVKGNRVKGKSKESRDINLALDNIKAQIIKHNQRISDREAFVTAEMVRNAYQGIGTEYETLLQAFVKENGAFAKRVGKDRSLSTYQKYLTVRKYLAEFIKVHHKRIDIAMNELTEDFICD